MDRRYSIDLDNYITGHYGEDQFEGEEPEEPEEDESGLEEEYEPNEKEEEEDAF